MTVIADRHDCAIQMITIDSRLKSSLYFSVKRQFHRRASKVSQICNPVIKSNYARQKLVGVEYKDMQKFAKFVKFQHGIDRSSSSNSIGGVMSFVSIQFESILSYRSGQLDTFRIDVSSYRPEEEISYRSGRLTSHRPRVNGCKTTKCNNFASIWGYRYGTNEISWSSYRSREVDFRIDHAGQALTSIISVQHKPLPP